MTPTFKKFPSIENFQTMFRSLKKGVFITELPIIRYRGKVKLHGTNAGVHILVSPDGTTTVTAMKRTGFCYPGDDNAGFAAWVQENHEAFRTAPFSQVAVQDEMTIFGEWAGPGVQKNDAVTKIPQKTFFIFGIRIGELFISDPGHIRTFIKPSERIRILPWATPEIIVDFRSATEVNKFIDFLNEEIAKMEIEDPYIKSEFDVSDAGEGFVMYPVVEWGDPSMDEFSSLAFKAKTLTHANSGSKVKAVEIDVVAHSKAMSLAEEYVTDARMSQAVSETLKDGVENATLKDLGPLIKWMNLDVMKESVASLEESGLEWKQVAKCVSHLTKTKFEKLIGDSL